MRLTDLSAWARRIVPLYFLQLSIFIQGVSTSSIYSAKKYKIKETRYIYFDIQKFRFQSEMRNQAWL